MGKEAISNEEQGVFYPNAHIEYRIHTYDCIFNSSLRTFDSQSSA